VNENLLYFVYIFKILLEKGDKLSFNYENFTLKEKVFISISIYLFVSVLYIFCQKDFMIQIVDEYSTIIF